MKAFAALYAALDATTATQAKVDALVRYFRAADDADAAWAAYFLAGGRPRQVLPTAQLRELARAEAGIDEWLFDASYQAVGDLAETIALLLPPGAGGDDTPLSVWVEQRLLPLRDQPPEARAQAIRQAWAVLDTPGRFLLTKLIGGGFRVGVSRLLVQRALAEVAGLDGKDVAQRMMGYTDAATPPTAERYRRLVGREAQDGDAGGLTDALRAGQPYPFFLAHPLTVAPDAPDAPLGPPGDWLVEWKYDGIRAQLVRRAGQTWLWSRGEELITDRFPEIAQAARALPDGTVLDGEVLVWQGDGPAPFQVLQRRIGRKTLSRRLLAEAPAVLRAYDLLQWGGDDLRGQPQHLRRARLEAVVAALAPAVSAIGLSPAVPADTWGALAARRAESRARGVEGLMLKHRDSAYGSGRTKSDGIWWKWKIDPLSVDAVLVYAQAGHGRRASLYTDYTLAVWSRAPRDEAEAQAVLDAIARREPALPGALQLLPVAKAYSGLTDAEIQVVDRVIRANTLEKFGPVRAVRPTLVVEIGFEGIQRSARHRSGVALRFPRILRLRSDKKVPEADALDALNRLIGDT
jgi:DNA ligase 1